MEVCVRIRTVTGLLMGVALVLVLAAPAAAQAKKSSASDADKPLFGVGLSFLHGEGETGKGFTADVLIKNFKSTDKMAIGVLGDVGFYHFTDEWDSSFMGGVRVTGTSNAKVMPFGQFLIGIEHGGGATDTAFEPGGGVDVPLSNQKFNFRVAIGIRFIKGDFKTFHATKFTVGISCPIGNK